MAKRNITAQIIILAALLLCYVHSKPIVLSGIRFYQEFISPRKGWHCAHNAKNNQTSCSNYASSRIRKYGIIKGLYLSKKRFGDCAAIHRPSFG
ncbi:membrane protein insertion efficiency factor YidD [Fibrobacterota bacterium]